VKRHFFFEEFVMPIDPVISRSSSSSSSSSSAAAEAAAEAAAAEAARIAALREALRAAKEAARKAQQEAREDRFQKGKTEKGMPPQAKKALGEMQRLARTAEAMYGDKTPNGMCAQAVRTILDAGNFAGADAGRNRGSLGLYGAKDYGEYWNNGGAAKDGLERLDITNPYDAPPGSIIVIKPGHNANSTWGDINIAVGNGRFINDGNMQLASEASWGPGDLLGVYAPIGASKIPGLKKLAGSAPPPGDVASYTPTTAGDSSSYTSANPPSADSPKYWDYFPTPEANDLALNFDYLMLLLESVIDVQEIKKSPEFKKWKKENPHGNVKGYIQSQLSKIESKSNGYFDLAAISQGMKAGDAGAEKQLEQLGTMLSMGTTNIRELAPLFKG
jgi:hypothetical protein